MCRTYINMKKKKRVTSRISGTSIKSLGKCIFYLFEENGNGLDSSEDKRIRVMKT